MYNQLGFMIESLKPHMEFDKLRQLKSITPYISYLQLFNTKPIMELGSHL
ncbi:hypothetical protein Hanom_Chr10g00923931 [Helianthus anomalus]